MTATDPRVVSAVLAPFLDHYAPSNRPRTFAEVLAEFGPVDVYTTAFDHSTKRARRVEQAPAFRRVDYVPSPPYRSNVSPGRLLSHSVFSARAAARFARRRSAYDLVYATAPLSELALAAFRLSRTRVKVLDVVDIWPDVLPFSDRLRRAAGPAFRAWRATFDRAVASADAVAAVSDRFLDEARPHFRGDPSRARRFYIGGDAVPTAGVAKDPLLTVAYVGNIGHLYDFDALVEAAGDPSVRGRVQVFVVGDGDRRPALLAALADRGVPHTYFGPVYDPVRLGGILGRCHLGFNGYLNTTAAFSYKANTYLGAGLPLLNSMGGDIWSLVDRHDLGYNYAQGSAAELLQALRAAIGAGVGLASNVDEFFARELSLPVVRSQIRSFVEDLLP